MQKTHYLNLAPQPFLLIKEGKKSVELRLFDEKRKCIAVGDKLIFTNNENGEVLERKVSQIKKYRDFIALYEDINPLLMGYLPGEKASYLDMNKYYSEEKIAKYGVVALFLA